MTNNEFNECIRCICRGDRDGLRQIYEAYDAYIFMIMKNLVGNRETAEDLTTDFFIKLWSLAESYKMGNGHKTWMTVIARNMAIDWLRKEGRQIPTEDPEPLRKDVLTSQSAEDEVLEDVGFKDMIKELKADEQEILTLKFVGQLSFKEIAQTLDIPMGTVTWKYQNCMKKLRRAVS